MNIHAVPCIAAKRYIKLFECKPIEWNRIGAFQDVTMRMIAAVARCIDHLPANIIFIS